MPRLGDELVRVLEKASRGEPLLPGDLDTIRFEGNNAESAASLVRSWAPTGDTIRVKELWADRIHWGGAIAPMIILMQVGNQTIATSTPTALNFGSSYWDVQTPQTSRAEFSVSGTSIIHKGLGIHDVYMIFGQISFDTNGTGIRIGSVRENGTSPWSDDLFHFPSQAEDWAICPFCSIIQITAIDSTGLQIYVEHTSGGNLDIVGGDITVLFLGRDIIG